MKAPRPPLDPETVAVLVSVSAWGRHAPMLTTYIECGNQAAFAKLLDWRATVAHRTFSIELKVDLGDEGERFAPMRDIVLQFARDLLATSALLASDVRPPRVSVFTEDMFMTTEEIEVKLPSDDDVTEEVTKTNQIIDDQMTIMLREHGIDVPQEDDDAVA